MQRRKRWRLLVLLLVAPAASGWNDTGHMVAALIAYDRMPSSVSVAMGRLLHSHPRFQEDFVPRLPKALRNAAAAEQDRWYFAFASTWPDEARRFDNVRGASARDALVARYNRASWHYINLPTYLQPSDRSRIAARAPQMNPWPGLDDSRMNLVQAIETLMDDWCGSSDAERALALAWITHLTADVHQPLHATTLYAFPAFIRADRGDRGGNDVLVTGETPLRADNLHALWDGALGYESKYRQLEALARDYGRAAKVKNDDKGDLSRKLQSWVKQSRALASSDAYTPEIRSAIAAAGDSRQVTVFINNAYLAAMRATAVRQIGLAGRRTASVLEALAVDAASVGCARQAG
jgi:hypothetical protein